MFKKIVLLSLLSTVVPTMGMENQPSQTTPQKKYSPEDYTNFINNKFIAKAGISEEFSKGFINFVKSKKVSQQIPIFIKFVESMQDPKSIKILSAAHKEILDLSEETLLFSGLALCFGRFSIIDLKGFSYSKQTLKSLKEKLQKSPVKNNALSVLAPLKDKEDQTTAIKNYFSTCALLEIEPCKALIKGLAKELPLDKVVFLEEADLMLEALRQRSATKEEVRKLDTELCAIFNPQGGKYAEEDKEAKKIMHFLKESYTNLSFFRELSQKPIEDQVDGFRLVENLSDLKVFSNIYQPELLTLHPLALLQSAAFYGLLEKKLTNATSEDFEKIFQEASRLGMQGQLAKFCLPHKSTLSIDRWASHALTALGEREPALRQEIQRAVNKKKKNQKKQDKEKELSEVRSVTSYAPSSVPSSVNTLDFGNRLAYFNRGSEKPASQMTCQEKAAGLEQKITCLYEGLELRSAEEFQTIEYRFAAHFYNHAKAHTITTEEADQLKDLKILKEEKLQNLLAQGLNLPQLMEKRTILTAFILDKPTNPLTHPSDNFIRYVQEKLLDDADKTAIEERSFDEEEKIYIGMRWKTKTPFKYVEFTKDKEDFIVNFKEGQYFTGALDEEGNPLTIYPVEKSIEEEMGKMSLNEPGTTTSSKKNFLKEK